MSCWAILLAGGSGCRFAADAAGMSPEREPNKLLVPLNGLPVLFWSLRALLNSRGIDGVVLTAAEPVQTVLTPWLLQSPPDKPLLWAAPGVDRRGSVRSGLQAIDSSVQTVLIHDGARPLADQALFEAVLAAWNVRRQSEGLAGLIVGTPMIDSIKEIQADAPFPQIARSRPRHTLWQVQTPQVFDHWSLLEAHERVPAGQPVTDDAQLLELAGLGPVGLFEGPRANLKLTTRADLPLLEALFFNE